MTKQKQCIDFYGEKLKVGDEVIPVLEEALIIGIGGFISKIEYSERYNNYYITITDKDANVLLEGVDAKCYTTQARYNEREDQEYVYSLTFYNKRFWPIASIPLTNKTDSDYKIPDETCFASLDAEHLKKREKQLTEDSCECASYISSRIYYFIIDGKVENIKEGNFRYLLNPDTHDYISISDNNKAYKNIEELKKCIKSIIDYFNKADLTYVNNDEEFDKNENGKEFEKKLIHHLK